MQKAGLWTRLKAAVRPMSTVGNLGDGGWSSVGGVIKEAFSGAWQHNVEESAGRGILSTSSVYSCVNVIASDIAKLPIGLTWEKNGARVPHVNSPTHQVLNNPNPFQTRLQFMLAYMSSKLINGNVYVYKVRDNLGIVRELHVLNPHKVRPLVAVDGSVFYEIGEDALNEVEAQIIVPAREIIHDRMITLDHPLVGVSPLFAAGVSAMIEARILMNSENFFANMSRPSGTINMPGTVTTDVAIQIRDSFEKNYSGAGLGRIAVLSQGAEYKPLTITPVDAQLIDQLKWTVTDVARVYRVPLFLLNEMQGTQYKNTEAMMSSYYQGCLQFHMEAIEQVFMKGFELPNSGDQRIEFDLTQLFRIETDVRYDAYQKSLASGWMSINEVRKLEGLAPMEGGEVPRVQMQYVPIDQPQPEPVAEPAAVPAPENNPPAEDDVPVNEPETRQSEDFSELSVRIMSEAFIKRIAERSAHAKR